jgi:phenylacetate-CoA ligase
MADDQFSDGSVRRFFDSLETAPMQERTEHMMEQIQREIERTKQFVDQIPNLYQNFGANSQENVQELVKKSVPAANENVMEPANSDEPSQTSFEPEPAQVENGANSVISPEIKASLRAIVLPIEPDEALIVDEPVKPDETAQAIESNVVAEPAPVETSSEISSEPAVAEPIITQQSSELPTAAPALSLKDLQNLPTTPYEVWQQANTLFSQTHLHQGARAFLSNQNEVKYQFAADASSALIQSFVDDFARGFFAAGIHEQSRVYNGFSMLSHQTSFLIDQGLLKTNCTVLTGGGQSNDQQALALSQFKADVYVGPFKQLLTLIKAYPNELKSIKRAVFFNESIAGEQRERFESLTGIVNYCLYGSGDLGCIAYESVPHQGFIVNESYWVDVVYPGTARAMPFGEIGEVVVSRAPQTADIKADQGLPIIRVATGNLAAFTDATSVCGRTHLRLKSFVGKVDRPIEVDHLKIRAQDVYAIEDAFSEIGRVRLVVKPLHHQYEIVLHCESPMGNPSLTQAVKEHFKQLTQLDARVVWADFDTLPRDGRWLEDQRLSRPDSISAVPVQTAVAPVIASTPVVESIPEPSVKTEMTEIVPVVPLELV